MNASDKLAERARHGHDDGVPSNVFEIARVHGHGFGPAEFKEKEADGAQRVDMGKPDSG